MSNPAGQPALLARLFHFFLARLFHFPFHFFHQIATSLFTFSNFVSGFSLFLNLCQIHFFPPPSNIKHRLPCLHRLVCLECLVCLHRLVCLECLLVPHMMFVMFYVCISYIYLARLFFFPFVLHFT